jgi:hypothetical protein
MRRNGFLAAGLTAATVIMAFLSRVDSAAAQSQSAPLLTQSQHRIDELALSLRDDPAVKAARQKMFESWSALPLAQLPDGKATLQDAVDEAVYIALRSAASDPSRPEVIWTEAPPYTIGQLQVPSSRNGDSPDRIYRFASLDPRYSYVIHGRRNARPSLSEFSFEATKPPAAFGAALSHLSSKDIDIAADGSFTVTADATPVNGRRNHLYLPPGASNVLIRDTLVDWASQLPNDLTIEQVDGQAAAPRSHAELAQEAAQEIDALTEIDASFLKLVSDAPVNQITPPVRPLAWGLPGSGIAGNRFRLKKGEALVVTIDPLGGNYVGFVVGDPWLRSVNYWSRTGSLNNHQAKPNRDGTITYVIAAKDPGVYNWLDTGGLKDGVISIRWEGLPPNADIRQAVKSVRLTPITKLGAALPEAPRITPQERRELLAKRQTEYALRVAVD